MLRRIVSNFALVNAWALVLSFQAIAQELQIPSKFTNQSEQVQMVREYLKTLKPERSLSVKQSELKALLASKARGGLSDGGGNAVGAVLFDHYENQGSFVMSSQYIINWNDELRKLLLRANLLVPRMGDYTERGLGDELVLAIRSKKWLLETKPMSQESCLNDSMVQSIDQSIVGCQNFYEVRIAANWVLNVASEKHQADLFAHEAILSWLRDLDKTSSKAELEFKVRELIRLLSEELTSTEFVNSLEKLIPGGRFYNSEEGGFIQMLPQKVSEIKHNFCVNNTTQDYSKVMTMFSQYSKSYQRIDEAFKLYLSIVRLTARMDSVKKATGKTIADAEKIEDMRKEYCDEKKSELPDLSHVEFKPDLVNDKCRQMMEDAFERYIEVADQVKYHVFEKRDADHLLGGAYSLAKISSLSCSTIKGIEIQNSIVGLFISYKRGRAMMDEVGLQALKYFSILKEEYDKRP